MELIKKLKICAILWFLWINAMSKKTEYFFLFFFSVCYEVRNINKLKIIDEKIVILHDLNFQIILKNENNGIY